MDQTDISHMAVPTQNEKVKKSKETTGNPGDKKFGIPQMEKEDDGLKKDDLLDMFGHVRDIRVEAQNLQRLLNDLKQKTRIEEPGARDREIADLLAEWLDIYTRNAEQIRFHFLKIKSILERNSEIYDSCGDEITRMDNSWDRVAAAWPALKIHGVASAFPDFPKAEEALGEIIFHAGYITIPSRVNGHLDNKWVGQQLDFHRTFTDELPSECERQEILNRLHENPMALNGIVDPQSGMIFHIAGKSWRRVASYVLMALAFIGCGALAVVFVMAGDWLKIPGYLFSGFFVKPLLINYLAIMIGGLAHLGFNALKQYRSSKEGSFVALGNWFLWGHVKEKTIIGGIFMIWVVYLGCLIARSSLDAVTFFFIGYSFDSFIDLFLKRFQIATGKKVEALKSTL